MRTPTKHRVSHGILLVLLAFLTSSVGCRLFTRDVACRRDRDCPKDAGLDLCTSWDAGIGTCTDDETFAGDFKDDDAGPEPTPDAGVSVDGGLDAGGA